MSRVGKQPIQIPEGVDVKIEGQVVKIKGAKGQLQRILNPEIKARMEDNKLILSVSKNVKEANALWGLNRALLANMIKGVTEGFEKKLEIQGVGYRAQVQGRKLILDLGFSHPIEIEAPKNIEFKVDKNTISISGIDKQLVGQVAANIRKIRPPEPYKGKGIMYAGEHVRRKIGKKAVAAEGVTGGE